MPPHVGSRYGFALGVRGDDRVLELTDREPYRYRAHADNRTHLVVQGDTLYTATPRETVALDATTCALRWKFTYRPEEERCAGSSRGVALHDGRIFRGTCDGRMIALDAATGRLLWKNAIAVPQLGESTTAAPLAWLVEEGPVIAYRRGDTVVAANCGDETSEVVLPDVLIAGTRAIELRANLPAQLTPEGALDQPPLD